ncbi:MAG: ATP-binding protein [Bacteroidota bacterium]
MTDNKILGRVIGTEDSTPLEFWVAIATESYIQLDDVVALQRKLPGGRIIEIYGMVTQVRARHEGARFDSDVFLIADGILPAEISQAAKIITTRFEPEIFVPPLPGEVVEIARNGKRDHALFFDQMKRKLAIGLSRDGEVFHLNFDFLNGSRGAHVNISGVSGVATKTSYASFLLYSVFHSKILGNDAINTKAIIYNVKGEDLLFLDHKNVNLDATQREKYNKLGLSPGAFESVEFWAPPRKDDPNAVPDVSSRQKGITSFFWTIAEFCKQDYLTFLFADAEDDRQQYTIVVQNVMAQLRRSSVLESGGVRIDGTEIKTFQELADCIVERLQNDDTSDDWSGRAIGQGTINAFIRRLYSAVPHIGRLVRGDISKPEKHQIKNEAQVTVVDIHNLNDRAKRFVVGITLRKIFDEKERSGQAQPLLFVVLDELNKYAPREGSSPIKEILVDVAERGRSLGIILIGAQQTASEIEKRIVANSAIRIVGRLDSAEAGQAEYGFLPAIHRQRATILKPGTMILAQPELPIPLVLEFPFPSWATRSSEAVPLSNRRSDNKKTDPFEGL